MWWCTVDKSNLIVSLISDQPVNNGLSVLKKKKRLLIQIAFLKKETRLGFLFVDIDLFQHVTTMANCQFADPTQSSQEQFGREFITAYTPA